MFGRKARQPVALESPGRGTSFPHPGGFLCRSTQLDSGAYPHKFPGCCCQVSVVACQKRQAFSARGTLAHMRGCLAVQTQEHALSFGASWLFGPSGALRCSGMRGRLQKLKPEYACVHASRVRRASIGSSNLCVCFLSHVEVFSCKIVLSGAQSWVRGTLLASVTWGQILMRTSKAMTSEFLCMFCSAVLLSAICLNAQAQYGTFQGVNIVLLEGTDVHTVDNAAKDIVPPLKLELGRGGDPWNWVIPPLPVSLKERRGLAAVCNAYLG